MSHFIHCTVCKSESAITDRFLFDDRFGYPGEFILRKCSSCGHRFLENDFSPEQINNLYTSYYPRSSLSLEEFRPREEVRGFKAWLNGCRKSAYSWVPPKIRVLDIGCGFGETLAYHSARGCDVYGVEADENIRRVADKFGYRVHIGLFDPALYEPGFFDYVTMDQVIEHVTDPLTAMRGIARVLKPEGKAVLSTPNANGWGAKVFREKWINWHAPYHLQFFSIKSMKIAAEQAGLLMERIQTITSSEWLHYQWIHLVTCPEMGTPSGFWSPKGKLKQHQRLVVFLFSLFHKTKISHVLTRFFDAVNLGDNYVFILRKAA